METFIFVLEVIGTIAFAMSGAIVAIKKKTDIFGVVFLGITTAVGGGIIRDILIGNIPPNAFKNEIYVIIAVVSSLLVFAFIYIFKEKFLKLNEKVDMCINIFDAIGLGVFTVNGMSIAMAHHGGVFLTLFVGMCTGVGGGIIRDVLINDVPFVLRKHVYAVASLTGGVLHYLLLFSGTNEFVAMIVSMIVIFVIRMLATKYKWNLPKITL